MKRTLLAILALALPALSQTSIKDALVKHWKVTGDFTLAVAKATSLCRWCRFSSAALRRSRF